MYFFDGGGGAEGIAGECHGFLRPSEVSQSVRRFFYVFQFSGETTCPLTVCAKGYARDPALLRMRTTRNRSPSIRTSPALPTVAPMSDRYRKERPINLDASAQAMLFSCSAQYIHLLHIASPRAKNDYLKMHLASPISSSHPHTPDAAGDH